jgi:hypothetical protein
MAYSKERKSRALELWEQHRAMKHVKMLYEREYPGEPVPDERTIRRWRDALPTPMISREELKNPILLAGLEQHMRDLTQVAKMLLANNLDGLEAFELYGEKCYGWIRGKDKYELISEESVTDILWDNLAKATEHFKPSPMPEMFMHHFSYETPPQARMMDMLKKEPLELIQILRLLVQRRTFKGTCDICKGWYK